MRETRRRVIQTDMHIVDDDDNGADAGNGRAVVILPWCSATGGAYATPPLLLSLFLLLFKCIMHVCLSSTL